MAPYTLRSLGFQGVFIWDGGHHARATLIGIDLGTHSFHVHGQDRHAKALLRKKFGRKQLIEFSATIHCCTVVMEACAGA